MSGKIKAALVVGGILLVLNLGSGLICQLCPLMLSLIGGVAVGWLAIAWTTARPDNPAAEGATAGILAALAGFVGQFVAVIINVLFFAASGYTNPLTGEQLITPGQQSAGVAGGIAIWGCAGAIMVAIMVGVAALTAKLTADRKKKMI